MGQTGSQDNRQDCSGGLQEQWTGGGDAQLCQHHQMQERLANAGGFLYALHAVAGEVGEAGKHPDRCHGVQQYLLDEQGS